MSETEVSQVSITKIETWAKKYGQSVDVLLEDFTKIMADQNARFPSKSQKAKETQARVVLFKRVRSDALNVQAIFFGSAARRDIWNRRKQVALDAFKDNEEDAINEGLVDEEGIPLDVREEITTRSGKVIPNPAFGARLRTSYARSSGALIRPLYEEGPGEWKPAAFNFRNRQSINPPPLDPVQTRGVLVEDTENRYIFSSDKTTTFQNVDIEHISDAEDPTIHALEIIEEKFPWIISTCEGIEDWMSKYSVIKDEDTEEETPDYNSWVILKGWVLNISMYDNDDGTKRAMILLVDEPDEDAEIVRISVASHLIEEGAENLEFGEGSYIWAVGSPYMREKYVDGQTIDDEYVPWCNAFGVFAVPEFRMDPEETIFQDAEDEVEEEFEE